MAGRVDRPAASELMMKTESPLWSGDSKRTNDNGEGSRVAEEETGVRDL